MFHLIEIAHAGAISDATSFKDILANTLNFLLSIVGIIAIIMLAISGALYFFSAGDEKKMQIAKDSTKYAVIGIVMALSGLIIIKTISNLLS